MEKNPIVEKYCFIVSIQDQEIILERVGSVSSKESEKIPFQVFLEGAATQEMAKSIHSVVEEIFNELEEYQQQKVLPFPVDLKSATLKEVRGWLPKADSFEDFAEDTENGEGDKFLMLEIGLFCTAWLSCVEKEYAWVLKLPETGKVFLRNMQTL